MTNRGKKLLLVVALTCLVFAGLAGYGDFKEVWGHLVSFPPSHLVAVFGLALLNYLLRLLRWAYFLHVLDISVPQSVSILTFLTGLAMTITPGKVGELIKCYLLRDRAGVPVVSSAPAVLMERLSDLVSVALMGLVGLALLPILLSFVVGITLAAVAVVIYLLVSRHTDRVLGFRPLRRWSGELTEAREGIRQLSRPFPLAIATVLGLLAWVSEGVALWIVLQGLGTDIGLILSLPIYAGSVLVGAATSLPGGLVGTEGAMVTLLQQIGSPRDMAAAGTLLVRVATLWFAVAVGLAAWAWLHWLLPRGSDKTADGACIAQPVAGAAGESPGNG